VNSIIESLSQDDNAAPSTEQTDALADILLENVEVDAPPVVIQTPTATIAVSRVSDIAGAEISAGGSDISFPSIGLAGGADIRVVSFAASPFPGPALSSSALSIDLGRPVGGLVEPIVFSLPITTAASNISNATNGTNDSSARRLSSEDLGCAYWSEDYGAWTSDGCEVDAQESTSEKLVCRCTHLTVFGALPLKEITEFGKNFATAVMLSLLCSNVEVLSSVPHWQNETAVVWHYSDEPLNTTTLARGRFVPTVLTCTPARLAVPCSVLGYSILLSVIGIHRASRAPHKHDFSPWFKEPPTKKRRKTVLEKSKERAKFLQKLCIAALIGAIFSRVAVPIGLTFLIALLLWTALSPFLTTCLWVASDPARICRWCKREKELVLHQKLSSSSQELTAEEKEIAAEKIAEQWGNLAKLLLNTELVSHRPPERWENWSPPELLAHLALKFHPHLRILSVGSNFELRMSPPTL
jgi:hypothetical protein